MHLREGGGGDGGGGDGDGGGRFSRFAIVATIAEKYYADTFWLVVGVTGVARRSEFLTFSTYASAREKIFHARKIYLQVRAQHHTL